MASLGHNKLTHFDPRKFEWIFRLVTFKLNLVNDDWGTSGKITLTWLSLDLTDDKSTLIQVMAWCSQETSHYLNSYGVTRPAHNQLTHRAKIFIKHINKNGKCQSASDIDCFITSAKQGTASRNKSSTYTLYGWNLIFFFSIKKEF